MDLKEIALNKSNKRHPWELARIKVVKHFIKSLLDLNREFITILDVGSGDTYLIKELSKEFGNASFFAVDIGYDDEYVAAANNEFIKENTKIRVFNNLTSAEKTLQHPVDLVLLLDVVEHVPDDVQFLQELAASVTINKDTKFLITVPAYQKLFCAHDVFLGHYRRYNNKLLKENISKAGLQVTNIGYFFAILLPPRYIQVLREKNKKDTEDVTGIGNWEGGEFASRVLTGILWIDFSLSAFLRKMGIKLPGLSNFAVCKKYA